MTKTHISAAILAPVLAFLPGIASPQESRPADSAAPAQRMLSLMKSKCAECHGPEASPVKLFGYIDDLARLGASEFVDKAVPEKSVLYTYVAIDADCPQRTKADKEAKRDAQKLTPDECGIVLDWIKAGAPPDRAPPVPDPPPVVPPPQAPAGRTVVTAATVLGAVIQDIGNLPPDERKDVRYLSMQALHNNTVEISDAEMLRVRAGVSKLLNSLSWEPQIANFPQTGPEGVLHRIRLRDIGWSAAKWDSLAEAYPYSIETDLLKAAGAATGCAVPVLRADWFAAVASRPPFYNQLLDLPKTAQELEKALGIDVNANLRDGVAMRSAFTRSGISRQNRMVERHPIRKYAGWYWKSYDAKSNAGKARFLDFPLGPVEANLAGGAHAFEFAGGEIIFALPNGMQAYYLADDKGRELSGFAPVEIVADLNATAGRAEIANGLSCIACHDRGMKSLPADEVRAVAASAVFSPAEQKLIRQLYVENAEMKKLTDADEAAFVAACAKAGVPEGRSVKEEVWSLVEILERDVTRYQAASELGLSIGAFEQRLETEPSLFDFKVQMPKKEGAGRPGGIPRERFVEKFGLLAELFDLGPAREHEKLPEAFQTVTHTPGYSAKPAARISVELTTSSPTGTFKAGDLMRVNIRTSEDCFVRLLYQDAEGKVAVLLPNAAHDGRISGNVPVVLGDESLVNPVTGKAYRFRIGPPFGNEMIAAIVSNTPFSDTEELRREALTAKGGGMPLLRPKGVEVEIVEAVRARVTDARIGIARTRITTSP